MNLPNKLSFFRICLVPIMMFLYLATFIPYGKIIAVVIFIIAAITDHYDGKIARQRNLVTDLGKLLDPLADKLLYTCALFLVVADGTILAPWGIIALTILFARDSLVNGIRQVAASKGVVVAAVWSGKLKAILNYIYIPMFMFISQGVLQNTGLPALDIVNQVLIISAYVMMGIATIVTLYSGVDYLIKNKSILSQKQEKEQSITKEENESESNSI